MKRILLGALTLWLIGPGVAQGQTKPVRLYIAPPSTVALPDIMKNLASKCPNTTITIDPQWSDFMLEAWGGSGNYKFTVFEHGGTAVYGTATVTLSNAVKGVCHFLESPQAQLNIGRPSSPPPQQVQAANVRAGALNVVRGELTNARDKLLEAANQSDYVQTAITRLDRALDDTKQAATHVNDDSAAAAPTAIPNFDAEPPPARLTNLMLYASLNSLKSAYIALTRVPGGDFGGYRLRMNDDIAAVAAVLVNGIASYNAKHPN